MNGSARVFSWPIRVYWEDTDAGGIVFYANYLKFFERTRTEWLRSFGVEQQTLKAATGGIFVIGETLVRYHRPAKLDDELLVTAQVQETGRASLTIAQQAVLKNRCVKDSLRAVGPSTGQGAGTALVCDGTIRIGWVDAATFKPARIPSSILEALKR